MFTAAVENGASVGTLTAIARTLGALMTFGMHHGYFQSEPFEPARMRRDVVRAAKQAAISRDGDNATGITIDRCPRQHRNQSIRRRLRVALPPATVVGSSCSPSALAMRSLSSAGLTAARSAA